jgi:hypothetical protein
MKIHRQHLCDLPFCYAVSPLTIDGRLHYILATDDEGPCYSIDSVTLEQKIVWESPGGTMSIVPLPGTNGEFLASQRFFPGFNASGCEIVHARYLGGRWQVSPWMKVPYLHRFDILSRGGVNYLLFCTLAEDKKNTEDWSRPGKLYAAELPSDFTRPDALNEIAGGMTRNHGYCRLERAGYSAALTGCDEGVFEVLPPEHKGGAWTVTKLLDRRVSDVAVCDIDGDGQEELATIEPFHGTDFVVYHQTRGGYAEMYRYPGKMAFVHTVWGGLLRGQPVFLGGCRALTKELFKLRWSEGRIREELIDTGKGPSNVAVIPGGDRDIILTANREAHVGSVYVVRDDV